MRRRARPLFLLAVPLGLLAPSSSRAADAPVAAADPVGPSLSVHVGYALLAGHFLADSTLDPLHGGTLVGGSLGWRFTRSFELSFWAEYAAGSAKMNVPECATTSGCSAHDAQVGIEAAWRFLPRARIDPWIGAGVGYEWGLLDYPALAAGDAALASVAHPAGSYLVTSPLLARLDLGADVNVDAGFAVGPWLAASIGRTSGADTGSTSDPPLHAWVELGVRGAFAP